MKYTTKELLEMSDEALENICHSECETKGCPFKSSLRKLMEDGICVKYTYKSLDKWINEDTIEIEGHKEEIEKIKERIKRYKKWKTKMEKELK